MRVDLLMTPGDSKNMAWTNTRGFWKTKLWNSLWKNSCLCVSLILFRSYLLAFYLTSFFSVKNSVSLYYKEHFVPSPGSCCQQLSWFAVIPYPYLFPHETLLKHCSTCDFIIHKCSSFSRDSISTAVSYQWRICGDISSEISTFKVFYYVGWKKKKNW